ncbi:MAG: hypothetical protein ABF289_20515 [Clostridiales bacterium]
MKKNFLIVTIITSLLLCIAFTLYSPISKVIKKDDSKKTKSTIKPENLKVDKTLEITYLDKIQHKEGNFNLYPKSDGDWYSGYGYVDTLDSSMDDVSDSSWYNVIIYYKYYSCSYFCDNGYAVASEEGDKKIDYFLIDLNTTEYLRGEFDYLEILATNTDFLLAVKDGHAGVIDFEGNVLVPFIYDASEYTKYDEYECECDYCMGVNDKLTECEYVTEEDKAYTLEYRCNFYVCSKGFIVEKNEKNKLIDFRGKEIFTENYKDLYYNSKECLYICHKDDFYDIYDNKLELIMTTKKDLEKAILNAKGDLYVCTKYTEDIIEGVIDSKGKYIIGPFKKEDTMNIIDFNNNYITIKSAKIDQQQIYNTIYELYVYDYDGNEIILPDKKEKINFKKHIYLNQNRDYYKLDTSTCIVTKYETIEETTDSFIYYIDIYDENKNLIHTYKDMESCEYESKMYDIGFEKNQFNY